MSPRWKNLTKYSKIEGLLLIMLIFISVSSCAEASMVLCMMCYEKKNTHVLTHMHNDNTSKRHLAILTQKGDPQRKATAGCRAFCEDVHVLRVLKTEESAKEPSVRVAP